MSSPLDPSALISSLPTLVGGTQLSSPQDALSALVHTILVSLDFRLIGIDDSQSTTNTNNILGEGWNKNGPGSYTFRYRHEQSSLHFLVKVTTLGSRTIVNAIPFEVSCSVLQTRPVDLTETPG